MDFVTEQFPDSDPACLDWLIRNYAKPNMVAFELGSYTGKSSLIMLPHIRRNNGHLYCVDWFQGNPGVYDINPASDINVSYRNHDILGFLRTNVKQSGYDESVTIMVGTTASAASIVGDEVADFIFIDADHRYSQIRRDILDWYPKLKTGGVMCGHDFDRHLDQCDYNRVLEKCEEDFVDGCHYGVIRAVCEIFPHVANQGKIWYVEKTRESQPRRDPVVPRQDASVLPLMR